MNSSIFDNIEFNEGDRFIFMCAREYECTCENQCRKWYETELKRLVIHDDIPYGAKPNKYNANYTYFEFRPVAEYVDTYLYHKFTTIGYHTLKGYIDNGYLVLI